MEVEWGADVAAGRRAVLAVATRYRQAAIYEYAVRGGQLERAVVWCDPGKQATQSTTAEVMRVVAQPPGTPMSEPRWHPAEA